MTKISKYIRRFLRFILFSAKSKKDYLVAYPEMIKTNHVMLKLLSGLATFIFLVCILVGHGVPNMQSKLTAYLLGLCLTVFVFVMACFSKGGKKSILFLVYLFDCILLGSGLVLSLISAPKQLTITLIPLVVIVPLLFDDEPWRVLLLILITNIVYLCFAWKIKPEEIIILDTVDVVAFSVAGLFTGVFVTKIKIERYVFAEEVKRKSVTDDLTGCYNRRAFEEFRSKGLEMEDLCIVMIDVNGLKKVNDSLGHKAGDELICTVADRLRIGFGEKSKCYRLGGDEFLVTANNPKEEMHSRLMELNQYLENYSGTLIKGISVSFGCAFSSEYPDFSVSGLMKQADKNMYSAKSEYYRINNITQRK